MKEIIGSWPENDYRYYLRHHGILEQRWGVRNGPPYPLSYDAHTTAQKKANFSKHNIGQNNNSNTEGVYLKDLKRFAREESKLTNPIDQKNFGVFGETSDKAGEIKWYKASTLLKYTVGEGKDNPLKGPKGFDGLYDRVNPNYGEKGTTNNCPFCAATMEIASRGYNVVARHSLGGATATIFQDWFKGAKAVYNSTWNDMKKDLLSAGDGASGVLQGFYGDGLGSGMGGHSLHWRNESGKIIVADAQSHKEMPFSDVISKYHFNEGECIYTRLDNCEIDWDGVERDSVVDIGMNYDNKRGWMNRGDLTVHSRY